MPTGGDVPRAVATAFREGHLGVMDYYNLKNLQSDTDMRHAIAGTTSVTSPAGNKPLDGGRN